MTDIKMTCKHDYPAFAVTPCAECSLDRDVSQLVALQQRVEELQAEITRLNHLMALNRAYPGQV